MVVLADQGDGFSVADLTAEAGVSHGTFYNYFADREELLEALVSHTVTRFAVRMADQVIDIDPAVRCARISASALNVALTEPQMIRVVLRVDGVQHGLLDEGPLAHLRQDLTDGFTSGRFSSPPDDGTLAKTRWRIAAASFNGSSRRLAFQNPRQPTWLSTPWSTQQAGHRPMGRTRASILTGNPAV